MRVAVVTLAAAVFCAEATARQLHARPDPQATDGLLFGVGNATWSGTPRIVSWHPLATVYDNFLTHEECDYLLKKARPMMEPAMIVNSAEHIHKKSPARTSHGAFFDSFEDDVMSMISHRIAHVAKVPPENLEPYQFMKYGENEQYVRHVDYYNREERFFGHDLDKFGGQRIKTALLYLTTAEEGGETVFHKAAKENSVGKNSCAGKGTAVNVVKGQLLIFHDILPNGELDPLTSHQSCPVIKGEKVVTVRFIREDACNVNKFFSWRKWNGNVFCEDDHTRCAEWAAQGHCTTSDRALRERMIGDAYWPGFCEKTCDDCRPLEETVIALRKEIGQEIPLDALPGRRKRAEQRMSEVYM